MDLAAVATMELHRFLLCLGRTSGLVAAAPALGGRFVPVSLRALLAVALALVVFPLVPRGPVPGDAGAYALALLAEVAVGLALGLLSALVFAAAQTAGELLDLETGFGVSGAFDPLLSQPVPLLGNLLNLVMLLVFLGVDGHHLLIRALVLSFRRIPPAGASLVGAAPVWVDMAGWMLVTALLLALPVLGVLFMVTLALSLLARAVPQMNVFFTGLPVKIAAGLLLLAMALPALAGVMGGAVAELGEGLARLVEGMAP
ncbi:MAG TPA: flagellar biosynthetic protein FliR [Thermaerobacter sp.]